MAKTNQNSLSFCPSLMQCDRNAQVEEASTVQEGARMTSRQPEGLQGKLGKAGYKFYCMPASG